MRPISTKHEIRQLAREAGLPTWDEPASACLSSRIPYFSEVTEPSCGSSKRAENVLHDLGFRVCRVGITSLRARVEVGTDELAHAFEPEVAAAIDRELRALGYEEVIVDPRAIDPAA